MDVAENLAMTLIQALHSRGMRVTPQRLLIHETLQRLDRHATAEQVRKAVADRLPGVSLPTVYATLDLLEDLGMVRRVRPSAGAVLYDPRTAPHHHAVCRSCGAVQDIEAAVDAAGAVAAARRSGFVPDGADTVVSGLCAACAAEGAS
jgi:Fe2+ or Zn2+ uptake regulation protein